MEDGKLKNPVLSSTLEEEEEKETYKDDDEENNDTICGICEKTYYADEFWIGCDTCYRWYHGKCVKISQAKSKSINQYKCPLCNKRKFTSG